MGSPAAAEEGGEAMGGGREESGKSSKVHERPSVTSTAPKARSRSRGVATLDEDVAENVIQITDIGTVVVVFGHHSARTDIGMPIYGVAFARTSASSSRRTRRGAVIRA